MRSTGKPANLIERLQKSLIRVGIRPPSLTVGAGPSVVTAVKGRLAYFFTGGTAFFLCVRFL
jgi:hypothetical protein